MATVHFRGCEGVKHINPDTVEFGLRARLPNRRLEMVKLKDGDYALFMRRLISRKGRDIKTTRIAISSEGMDALFSMYQILELPNSQEFCANAWKKIKQGKKHSN